MKQRYEFHDVQLSGIIENAFHALAIDERRTFFRPTLWTTRPDASQRVEQVWFPGVHSNVGGGYPGGGLSDISLLWMKERTSSCGLVFDEELLARTTHPDPQGELRNSKHGWYAVTPDYLRPIGEQMEDGESLHPSALARRAAELDPPYKPANVEAFLAAHPV